jgi:uncharacterized membrane protein YgcG
VTVGNQDVVVNSAAEGQELSKLDEPGGPTLTEAPELTMSPEGADALDGPFTTRQLLRLDEALRIADQQTGLTFSVYIGDLEEPTREYAEQLHRQLEHAAKAVLVAVSPNQRLLEIVTGTDARKRISDRDAKLAALSMAASFAGGDLAGGVLAGLDQLASHAGRH